MTSYLLMNINDLGAMAVSLMSSSMLPFYKILLEKYYNYTLLSKASIPLFKMWILLVLECFYSR